MKRLFLAEDFRVLSDTLENIVNEGRDKNDEFYVEPDDITGSYCVLGSESGHAYATYATREEAEKEAERMNSEKLKEASPEPKNADDKSSEKTVMDLMTKEKAPQKLEGNVSVKSLASDLGLENINEFQSAFNMLRQGKMPTKPTQIRELAMAFDRLLAADASTTSRVLTKLRQIHKADNAKVSESNWDSKTSAGGEKDIKRIYSGTEGWVYQPLTAAGAKHILKNNAKVSFGGQGGERFFDMYNAKGPIYVIYDRNNKQMYTVHPATNSYVDKSGLSISGKEELPSWAVPHINA